MNWQLKMMNIHTKSGPESHLGLTLQDKLGIFVDINDKLAVTHLASGKRIFEPFKPTELPDALRFAENILTLAEWDIKDPSIPDDIRDKLAQLRGDNDTVE